MAAESFITFDTLQKQITEYQSPRLDMFILRASGAMGRTHNIDKTNMLVVVVVT
jgi:hypothetical protein